ncbi:MAG: translation elongation factor Ts [Candidatus Eisenbacteria bacterium]|uniref:Elongation factor Ts n=1 Tax=Eiseniibacteriota bacterium TaxID=2212470 RepID=A0A956M1Y0_UNCEI|nr:translation elongation factor Ts [Candidatus Eisenbacteria bacterium]
MTITSDQVKALRDRTGAGVMQCKQALVETGGDMDKAIESLRKIGAAAAEKKIGRSTGEGRIEAYIHPGNRVGVLLEVDCETDFVARTDDFQSFCHDVALHIAAAAPIAVAREEVSADRVAKETEIFTEQAKGSGKPEAVWPKIVEGRMDKWYQEFVLLEQPFVKDPDKKVRDLLTELIAKLGENIVIKRFIRFQIGVYDN